MLVAMERTSASREFSISSSVFSIAAESLSIFRLFPWDKMQLSLLAHTLEQCSLKYYKIVAEYNN